MFYHSASLGGSTKLRANLGFVNSLDPYFIRLSSTGSLMDFFFFFCSLKIGNHRASRGGFQFCTFTNQTSKQHSKLQDRHTMAPPMLITPLSWTEHKKVLEARKSLFFLIAMQCNAIKFAKKNLSECFVRKSSRLFNYYVKSFTAFAGLEGDLALKR